MPVYFGSAGENNSITGSDLVDRIYGLSGDDRIFGSDALLYGGKGNDSITGDGAADLEQMHQSLNRL